MKIGLESIEQIKTFDFIRHHHIDDICFHIGNERACSPRQGLLLKRMGIKAGVSDIFIARASKGFHGLWIELKSKGGKLSPKQKEFIENMNREGYLAVCRYGSEEAIATIKEYLNLPELP